MQSDFARANAIHVARAACEGYITTRDMGGIFGPVWRITGDGLLLLEHNLYGE